MTDLMGAKEEINVAWFWDWLEDHCRKLLVQDDAPGFLYKWCVKYKLVRVDWNTLRTRIAKNKSQAAALSACLKTAIILYENRDRRFELSDDRKRVASTAFVRRHFHSSHEDGGEDRAETIAVHTFATEPAILELNMGLTMNLGNFEFSQLRRGLVVPCYREEVPVVEKLMTEWVTSRIRNDRKRIKGKTDFVEEPDLCLTGHDQEKLEDDDEDDASLLSSEE